MGLVHVRDLDEIPPPQLDVHSVQLLQGVKPPFTGKKESKKHYQQNASLVRVLCKTIWRVKQPGTSELKFTCNWSPYNQQVQILCSKTMLLCHLDSPNYTKSLIWLQTNLGFTSPITFINFERNSHVLYNWQITNLGMAVCYMVTLAWHYWPSWIFHHHHMSWNIQTIQFLNQFFKKLLRKY